MGFVAGTDPAGREPMETTTRNATLQDMADLLTKQQADKLDLVVPATSIRSVNGNWVIAGADQEPFVGDDGPEMRPVAAAFTPTVVADEHLSDKLGIPLAYVRRMRAERPDLYDANANGLLHGRRKRAADGSEEIIHRHDSRKFLVRTFRGSDGEPGVARALLSDRYRTVDNLDVLVAALDGVRDAGVNVEIDGCDLTDRRMYVRIVAPQVAALAPEFLRDYRSPWGGTNPWDRPGGRQHGWLTPDEQPVVFAGFVISNSETGGGAFSIIPRLMVKICWISRMASRLTTRPFVLHDADAAADLEADAAKILVGA